MIETIGKRIASLRQKNGWTQQSLTNRLAMSRVAISHIEMDLTIPSERSITLMAGIFKLSPRELVEGTSYPNAKAERLPELTTIYTELELKYAILKNDIEWFYRLVEPHEKSKRIQELLGRWSPMLEDWEICNSGEYETNLLNKMRQLQKILNAQ